MMSSIFVSYLALVTLLADPTVRAGAWQPATTISGDPDALYRERAHAEHARAAERIWAARLIDNSRDFEAAWKLARARYWLGTNDSGGADARKRWLERGIEAGRLAISAREDAVDGHFWMAANMGALADAHGLRQGLRYRTPIRTALEKALVLHPAYLDGSPDRALGRWYFKVPGLFGGDLAKSEAHLRKALSYNGQSVISLLFLAETLHARDKKTEARATLQAALDAPLDPDWGPEDAGFKAQARALMRTWTKQ